MENNTSQNIPVALSPKEFECLNWVMEGKSSWEIGVILGCQEATVNFHIANVMGKLHVSTRMQAIIKSLRMGLIKL